jgi:hypothetical protein
VALQTSTQSGVWVLDREMPVATTPIAEGHFGLCQTATPRLAPQSPATSSGPRPIARESQEVKGGWAFPALLPVRRPPEWPQARFLRMKGQAKARYPLAEYRLHSLGVVLLFKPDDEIIAIAAQPRLTSQTRLHLRLKPQVQRLMQVHVTQQRREH